MCFPTTCSLRRSLKLAAGVCHVCGEAKHASCPRQAKRETLEAVAAMYSEAEWGDAPRPADSEWRILTPNVGEDIAAYKARVSGRGRARRGEKRRREDNA